MSKHFVSQRRLTVLVRLVDKKVLFQLISFRDIFSRPKKELIKFVKKSSFCSFCPRPKIAFCHFNFKIGASTKPEQIFKKMLLKANIRQNLIDVFPPTEDINIINYECIYCYLKTYEKTSNNRTLLLSDCLIKYILEHSCFFINFVLCNTIKTTTDNRVVFV